MAKSKRPRSTTSVLKQPKITILRREKFLQILQKYLWCVIILLAVFVRFWKIEYIPFANDADELAYIWAGQSLVEFGTPISWSSFAHVETQWHWTKVTTAMVTDPSFLNMKFIRPWFDHSFVLPILMGSWSHVLGYSFPSIPPALLYRLPFLVIAAINLSLIYHIAFKAFGRWPALFSLMLISFSPVMIFAQRMVVSENLMTTFILLSIYLSITQQPLWSLVLASAFAGLVKLPGLSLMPVFILPMLAEKKYSKVVGYCVGVFTLVVAGYGIYGASIDWQAFISAMTSQSSRLLGWSNPTFLFSQPGFHTKSVLDFSYYVVLILGMSFFLTPMTKEKKLIATATLVTLLTTWMVSAEQDMLGWYKIPLFCLLAISAGGIFRTDETKRAPLTGALLLVTIMVMSNTGIVRFPNQPLPEANMLRAIVGVVLLGGSALFYWTPKTKILGFAVALVLCLYAMQSFYIADNYFEASCKDRNCPTPVMTVTGMLKSAINR